MDVTVYPGKPAGEIAAIPSKSHAHRLLICAALADKPTRMDCAAVSRDITATADCLRALGALITHSSAGFSVTPRAAHESALLPCGESGSTYRFLLPVACALGVNARFMLLGRLASRPMDALMHEMAAHGIAFAGAGSDCVSAHGRMTGGRFSLPGDISSQFVSGLCFALPLTSEGGEIALQSALESRGYVDMTLSALRAFGVSAAFDGQTVRIPGAQRFLSPGLARVPGDYSNAAFLLCAAAATGGDIAVSGLPASDTQGDRAIENLLAGMGARIERTGDTLRARGGAMAGRVLDIRDTPDLAPALAVAALGARGQTVLTGCKRLRLKESDRLASIPRALQALGAKARAEGEEIVIDGGLPLRGGRADAAGDHRIAMMLACAAPLCARPVEITGAQAVEKSYPAFFDDLRALGVPSERSGL